MMASLQREQSRRGIVMISISTEWADKVRTDEGGREEKEGEEEKGKKKQQS